MKILQRIAKLPVIAVLAAVFLFFSLYLFPSFHLKEAAKGLESLDIRSSYSLSEVQELFKTLGVDGIRLYKEVLIADTVFPWVYSFLMMLLLVWLQKRMGRLGTLAPWISWIPLVNILFDYSENINTWCMLSSYPVLTEKAVRFGSMATTLKWYGISVCAGMVVCALLAVVLRNTLWKWRNAAQKGNDSA